jgi:hypothetical protein
MLIRLIDIICYLVVFVGGIFALFFTPDTVTKELNGFEWMIGWWATFLLVGGLMGLVGRITTIWIIEPAADVAAFIGIIMYFVIIGVTAFSSITAAVATCLVFVAGLGVARRYLELQLFGSDPTRRDWRSRIEDAFQRRIPNVPPRG